MTRTATKSMSVPRNEPTRRRANDTRYSSWARKLARARRTYVATASATLDHDPSDSRLEDEAPGRQQSHHPHELEGEKEGRAGSLEEDIDRDLHHGGEGKQPHRRP